MYVAQIVNSFIQNKHTVYKQNKQINKQNKQINLNLATFYNVGFVYINAAQK